MNSGDPARVLATVFTAPGEMASFFGRLEKVSPSEIQPDVKTLHDNSQKLADQLGETAKNPIGGLFTSLSLAAGSKAAEDHVNAYTLKHCGPPPR